MELIKCEKCEKEIQDDFNSCPYCGAATDRGVDLFLLSVMKWVSLVLGISGALIYSFVYNYALWVNAIGWTIGLIGLIIGIKAIKKINAIREIIIKKGLAIAGIVLSVMAMLCNSNPFFDAIFLNNTTNVINQESKENSIDEASSNEGRITIGDTVAEMLEEFKEDYSNYASVKNIDLESDIVYLYECYDEMLPSAMGLDDKLQQAHLDSSLFDNKEWILEVSGYIAFIRYHCNRIIEFNDNFVPADIKEFHRYMVLNVSELDNYCLLLTDGIDNKDIDKINDAGSAIERAKEYREKMNEYIAEYE